ncbi:MULTISPECIES: CoA-disulfide reductase [unclassified Bacillus (in: firmicutes)]|uniref:CoA-disulfide reductase n=1 Tax=unclassified Bacillus (in: firmicutes) TaxID=185979 RepID=UPI0008ED0E77|nr:MULTISPECIES: CoA-disulfide reductase [unclassified Bacillus (in: firmicutes)]SFA79141.1 CoA-disulfide reductase [Bacillus sp. UNCCL13]SFQ69094.1 CoA-disulfide reductase [Bacillus sp. cl95]
MNKKVVIVGGVAGGATTATKMRRLDENAEITMFERGEFISFANCGLPYYIGEVIQDRSKLLVQTVEGMKEKYNLDIHNFTEVIRINRDRKTVTSRNLKSDEEFEQEYDVLVLSPGAKPIVPAIAGLQSSNVFTLRNIPDMDKIKSFIDDKHPKHAVVIGGGFIGLEMAENLVEAGVSVTIVEKANQVMAPIDIEMATVVQKHLVEKGIDLILEDGIKDVSEEGTTVHLESGKTLSSDLIILAIGVTPENALAKEAGLELGERGGIKVNEYMQTSDPSIYALGDAVEVRDYVNGNPTMIPLAWPANRQAHIVAHSINGRNIKYPGTLGTSIVKVFDLTVAVTGNNEKTLARFGIPYETIHIHPLSHAGYYPGAQPISMKLLFDKETGKIFGAQAIGKDGVDKRIDVLATAIRGGLTVSDLQELELAYAPPYSSAKDPVNMLGYVAANIVDGLVETVKWHEIDEIVRNGAFLLDVRTNKEHGNGCIEGSINIPVDELRSRLDKLPKDETIFITCQVGQRGYLASRILKQHGFDVKNLTGGYKTYSTMKTK